MSPEPIEVRSLARTSHRCANRRAGHAALPARAGATACALDEAFARFAIHDSHQPPRDLRFDDPQLKQSLVADLAAQLEAVDRQRARLAELLETVEKS